MKLLIAFYSMVLDAPQVLFLTFIRIHPFKQIVSRVVSFHHHQFGLQQIHVLLVNLIVSHCLHIKCCYAADLWWFLNNNKKKKKKNNKKKLQNNSWNSWNGYQMDGIIIVLFISVYDRFPAKKNSVLIQCIHL